MGLLSWLFPSESDRVAKAAALLDRDAFADARLEVLDIDTPEARAIVEKAERALAEHNLDAALSWARAGDVERVQIHLELANQFKRPDMDDLFRDKHRDIRGVRDSLRAAQAAREASSAQRHRPPGPQRQQRTVVVAERTRPCRRRRR